MNLERAIDHLIDGIDMNNLPFDPTGCPAMAITPTPSHDKPVSGIGCDKLHSNTTKRPTEATRGLPAMSQNAIQGKKRSRKLFDRAMSAMEARVGPLSKDENKRNRMASEVLKQVISALRAQADKGGN
jgi:hypothetical protein